MSFENYSDQLLIKGILVQVPNGQTSILEDITFNIDVRLKGATIIVSDCKYGDYGELSIHHPVTDAELSKFGENVYLPEGQREITVQVSDGEEIPMGVKIRVTLNAIDDTGRKAMLWLLVKR